MITLHHLRFLHKINDSLGRDVCTSIHNVGKQLPSKFHVVEEGITTGICVAMVGQSRPIANEILAPHLKPSTTATTLPDEVSSVIGGLSPSFS